ncbi:hypothetical protein [Novosphingobium decolorationis]|uniref:Uncharacterized protein n=1 Tax=Novosphingobium decolorationis TaxID=2698673 RepID=A0ABX8E1F3_9SPHN|nr:hypothetical protein [Novosphingobium decolorationis]MED5545638.1 hypothetical protein [Pseudomonadota bacterium]MEE3156247.1 hypothetical protein [Pseudomonadota bacterium]QVM82947.1 hypothetical protein HT578_03800 [Novosphingobium decolorationis]
MKHMLLDMGCHSLEVEVADDVDLDERFRAKDLHTGETILVNGWLIDNAEEI